MQIQNKLEILGYSYNKFKAIRDDIKNDKPISEDVKIAVLKSVPKQLSFIYEEIPRNFDIRSTFMYIFNTLSSIENNEDIDIPDVKIVKIKSKVKEMCTNAMYNITKEKSCCLQLEGVTPIVVKEQSKSNKPNTKEKTVYKTLKSFTDLSQIPLKKEESITKSDKQDIQDNLKLGLSISEQKYAKYIKELPRLKKDQEYTIIRMPILLLSNNISENRLNIANIRYNNYGFGIILEDQIVACFNRDLGDKFHKVKSDLVKTLRAKGKNILDVLGDNYFSTPHSNLYFTWLLSSDKYAKLGHFTINSISFPFDTKNKTVKKIDLKEHVDIFKNKVADLLKKKKELEEDIVLLDKDKKSAISDIKSIQEEIDTKYRGKKEKEYKGLLEQIEKLTEKKDELNRKISDNKQEIDKIEDEIEKIRMKYIKSIK